MYYRRHLALALLALVLAGCASGPPAQPATPAPSSTSPAALTAAAPAPATAAATVAPTAAATAPATAAPTAPATAAATAVPTVPGAAPAGEEILFLKNGSLVALDTGTRQERALAPDVREFAATADGRRLALVRGAGASAEIWLADRDGGNLRQLTNNDRAESGLSWAPDGMTLAYAAGTAELSRPADRAVWAAWCRSSEVRLVAVATGAETALAPGCDPAFAPDGRRIAFSAPPSRAESGGELDAANAVRVVNRQGENGWNFAIADGADPESGLLVYGPAWSPSGDQIAYHRFVGYRALVDLGLMEMGSSFERGGQLLAGGAGWLLPPAFAPGGQRMAVVEYNYSDARGFGGYELWRLYMLRLDEPGEAVLPEGARPTMATVTGRLPRVTGAAWAPDGSNLAVVLPAGWSAEALPNEPLFENEQPGTLWIWERGVDLRTAPATQIAAGIDYASPLAWLPAAPLRAVGDGGNTLYYPAGWQLAPPAGTRAGQELTAVAPDGLRLIRGAIVSGIDPAAVTVTDLFPDLVSSADDSDPLTWPDGSVYRAFTGTAPDGSAVAGAVRVFRPDDGDPVARIYRTAPELWLIERARAQALLAAGS